MAEQDEEAVLNTLRAKLQTSLKHRGAREFDRRIGRPETGWTSKFLTGRENRVPTIGSLLRILRELRIHPADFFAEAFPAREDEPLTPEEARAAYEGARAMAKRLQEMEARLNQVEDKLAEAEKESR
jgi:hypothetical protein